MALPPLSLFWLLSWLKEALLLILTVGWMALATDKLRARPQKVDEGREGWSLFQSVQRWSGVGVG